MIPPLLRRLALALLLSLALVAGAAADPGDPWWDGDWSARAPLTVTGASATEGVQAQVTVAYDSDMQTDFDDLRFVEADGATVVPYWIESKIDGTSAVVWVKLPASETTIYQYYGNVDATSANDGDAVFIFFDDFTSPINWSSKWQSSNQALYSTSGGHLTLISTNTPNQLLQTKNKYSNFRARVSTKVASAGKQIYVSADSTAGVWANEVEGIIDWMNSPDSVRAQIAGAQTITNEVENTSQYYEIDFTLPSSSDATISISKNGGSALVTRTASPTNREVYLSMFGYSAGGTCYSRYTYIREYVALEPTLTAGSEERSTPAPPVAAFTADVTSGVAPLTVQFTDRSTGGPTSWAWSFGDGNTSTAQNPQHTYTAPGTYTVTLNATNAYGFNISTRAAYITVSAPVLPPVVGFSASPTSGLAPLTVQFTDLSTGGPTSWAWSFGDGNTSTAQNPQHTYTAPGTYTVSLTATNAGGSDTETRTRYITVSAAPPTAPPTAAGSPAFPYSQQRKETLSFLLMCWGGLAFVGVFCVVIFLLMNGAQRGSGGI